MFTCVHPENSDWTCFEQSAELDIKNFFGFEGTAEKIAIKEYSKSIEKSKDIMEYFINLLAEQGITKVDIWQEPPAGKSPPETVPDDNSEKPKFDKLRRKSSAKGRDLEQSITEHTDPASKLEQDYIQMFLGKLEPMQEAKEEDDGELLTKNNVAQHEALTSSAQPSSSATSEPGGPRAKATGGF